MNNKRIQTFKKKKKEKLKMTKTHNKMKMKMENILIRTYFKFNKKNI